MLYFSTNCKQKTDLQIFVPEPPDRQDEDNYDLKEKTQIF